MLERREGSGHAGHCAEGVDLTVTVERIVTCPALARLRCATIHGREEGVNRKVRRAGHGVSRIGELGGYCARRGYASAQDECSDTSSVWGGHRGALLVAIGSTTRVCDAPRGCAGYGKQ